jgi:RNA polymerase sigma factor (sigma-70 family)
MTVPRLGGVLTRLRARAAGVSDSQLLGRFLADRDEAAFELLVRRHERLVFGVCRRVLHDPHDAEDAFQATFLALARKGAHVGARGAVAGWLYRVAYRVALAARAQRGRRGGHERPLNGAVEWVAAPPGTPPVECAELRGVLDEELSRLPERFRAAAVLCYLDGKTVEEAARELGCARGTVASRLARARARLREALARRGLALSAGLVAVALSQARAAAAPPEAVVGATLRAARAYAPGTAAAGGAVSAHVATLTEGVLQAMFLAKLKLGAAVIGALLAVLVAGGWLAAQLRASAVAGPRTQAASAPGDAKKLPAVNAQKKVRPMRDLARRQGDWERVSFEANGETTEEKNGLVWKIRGTTIFGVHRQTGQEGQTYLSLDERASPKAMDLVRGQANGSIGTERAIYKLEGDSLTLCTGRPNGERPQAFRADANNLFPTLTVFRRLKEADARLKPGPWDPVAELRRKQDLSPTGELTKLQGVWKLTKMQKTSLRAIDPNPGLVWKITGTTVAFSLKGKPAGQGVLVLGDKDNPKALDLLRGQADGSITIERDLYRLQGDVLTVCVNSPAFPRPAEFRANKEGSLPALYTFRRERQKEPGGEEGAVRIFPFPPDQPNLEGAARFLRTVFRPGAEGSRSITADEHLHAFIVRGGPSFLAGVEAAVQTLSTPRP